MNCSDKKLIALLLGDGYITSKNNFGFHHSIKQKDWVLYKTGILTSLGLTISIKESIKFSYGKSRKFIEVRSRTSDIIKDMRKLFYPNGEKIIPKGVLTDFGFEELAILYQDDGRQNKISHYNTTKNGTKSRVECEPFTNRYDICTQGFNIESNEELMSALTNLGIESRLTKVKSGYGNLISISKVKSKVLFYENIKEHVINAMKYKLSAKPSLAYS